MTIPYPSGGARVEVDGNGVSSTVAVPFAFWLGDDLRVIHTDASDVDTVWEYGPDFTISGGGGEAGGIAFVPANLAAGEKLTVLLADQGDQAISLNAGQLQPSTIETALDKLASRLQGVKEQVGRFVGLKESSRSSPPTLPDASAGKYLGWNGAGTDLENKATLSIGAVSQLAEGEPPTVTLNEDGTIDFKLPKGSTGDVGPAGASGTIGTGWTVLLAETSLNGLHSRDVGVDPSYNDVIALVRFHPELSGTRSLVLQMSDDEGATFESSGYYQDDAGRTAFFLGSAGLSDDILCQVHLSRLGTTMAVTSFNGKATTSNIVGTFGNGNDVDALRFGLFNSDATVEYDFGANATLTVYGR